MDVRKIKVNIFAESTYAGEVGELICVEKDRRKIFCVCLKFKKGMFSDKPLWFMKSEIVCP